MALPSRVIAGLSVVLLAGGDASAINTTARQLHSVPPPQLMITRRSEPTTNWWSRSSNRAEPRPDLQEMQAARKELGTVTANLRKQFFGGAEYTAAVQAVKDSRAAYQEATRGILAQVHASLEYKTKQIELMQAEQHVEAMRRGGHGFSELAAAAQRAAEARAALSKLETAALAADVTATAAKNDYLETSSHLRDLVEQFESTITSDPDWRAARSRVDSARLARR